MKHLARRIICLTLALMCIFSIVSVAQAATYSTNTIWEARTSSYVFKNTAYVTIKNTGSTVMQIAVGYTGCKVYRGTGSGFQTITYLYPGNSATYRIETPAFWHKGKVQFGMRSPYGEKYSYTITHKSCDSLTRTK